MTTEHKPRPVARYKVLAGINWPDGKGGERRAEPGAHLTASDLKGADLAWFVKVGALELEGGDV